MLGKGFMVADQFVLEINSVSVCLATPRKTHATEAWREQGRTRERELLRGANEECGPGLSG